jgi:hypothetical protein
MFNEEGRNIRQQAQPPADQRLAETHKKTLSLREREG